MNLFHSLAGMVDVELTSADIPASLIAAAGMGIRIMEIASKSDLTVELRIYRKDYKKLTLLCKKRGETVRLLRKRGIFWTVRSLLSRPVLMTGILTLVILALYVPSRVFFVEVEGNTAIPARMIVEAAEGCGIYFGASRREVRSERVKNALLQAVPGLQWAGVNTRGCVAVISVRERTVTRQQEETFPVGSIVAVREGIITECTALRGSLLCQPGQAVAEGEILISGYTDCGLTIQVTCAEGEVYARTQRRIEAVMLSISGKKQEISGFKKTYSLIIGKKRINLWKDSGIWDTTCGRIYEENYITLPGGFTLPVAIAVDSYLIGETAMQNVPMSEAEENLNDFASGYILQQMVAGSVEDQRVQITQEESCFRLEGEYVCTEMIGKLQREQIGEYNGESD